MTISLQDTAISVIDVAEERGYELRGHSAPVTKLCHLWRQDVLVSAGQDGHVKFWTLEERHCFKTVSSGGGDLWDFHYCEKRRLLVTGGSDALLRLWRVDIAGVGAEGANRGFAIDGSTVDAYEGLVTATFLGEVARGSARRVAELRVDEEGDYLIVNVSYSLRYGA